MLHGTPKQDANIFFMYQTGRNPDCASILLQTRSKSSSKMSENSKNDDFWTCFSIFTCEKTNCVPPTLEFSYPGKTYLERVYNFKITKKLSHMIIFRFPRSSLAVIFIFSSFGAATHGIRLPGETLSGA